MLHLLLRVVVSVLTVVMISACEPMLASSQQLEQMGAESYAKASAVAGRIEPQTAAPRCPHCGWIESKREIAPLNAVAHALASYEYTVRMRDGSSHVFREETPVSWRLGERLIFIEGSGPLK